MRVVHQFVCISVCISLFAQTATAALPYTFQNERATLDLGQYAQYTEGLSSDEKLFFESIFQEPLKETSDLLLLLETLEVKTKNLQAAGVDVEERVRTSNVKNEVIIELADIGTAKFVTLGYGKSTRIFTQVYLYRSNTVYNLIDKNVVNIHEWDNAKFETSNGTVTIQKADGTVESLPESDYRVKRRYLSQWKEYYEQQNARLSTRTQVEGRYHTIESQVQQKTDGTPEGTEAFLKAMVQEAAERGSVEKTKNYHTRAEYGQNVVNIFYDESLILSKQKFDPAVEKSGVNGFLNYLAAIKESPNAEWEHWDKSRSLKTFSTGDFRATYRSIIFQQSMTIPLALVFTPDHPYVGPLLTLTWGVVLGVYNKIYRNAQKVARTPAEKNILVSLVSLSYNYTFGTLMFGINALNPLTAAGAVTNLFLWINVWISSWAKVKFLAIPIAREEARMVPSSLRIPLTKIRIGWGPNDEAQVASNVTSAFKFIDLADKSILFGPAELKITLGKLLFIGSGFLMHLGSMWYTSKHNLPQREALKEEWARYHTLRKPFLTKEQQKKTTTFDEIAVHYPFTNKKVMFPLIGMTQDIIESILMTTLDMIKTVPRLYTSLDSRYQEYVSRGSQIHGAQKCSFYFK